MLACVGYAQASILDLKITEIMYHPNPGVGQTEKQLEFLEMKNTGSDPLNLKSLVVLGGIQFIFSSDYILAPNSFAVLVSDSNVFHVRYPSVKVAGQFSSNLANSGEDLLVRAGTDTLIEMEYSDDLPWSPLADGHGFSLVPNELNPTGDQDSYLEWTNSCSIEGSPGADDALCSLNFPDVWVNELLPHTDLPQVDAIEIYNNSSSAVDIGDWYLSDSKGNPYQYKIPNGTMIQPNSYYVVDESMFNVNGLGFRFNRSGDEVYLFSSNSSNKLTGFVTGWEFEAQYNGTSFGVHITSENEKHFVAQESLTLGSQNGYPKMGPLAFTQIMYNPNAIQYEYLKIENTVDTVVDFWHAGTPDSGWVVTGIGYKFPAGVSLKPGEHLFLTNGIPQDFKTDNGIPDSIDVYQYTGKLSNKGEDVSIWAYDRMDTTDLGVIFMPKVLIETVDFDDKSPWPLLSDGHGYFLKRKTKTEYGNDPINWEDGSEIAESIGEELKLELKPYVVNEVLYLKDLNQLAGVISIFDMNGSLVFSEVIVDDHFQVDIKKWSSGIYVLNVNSKRGTWSAKFKK